MMAGRRGMFVPTVKQAIPPVGGVETLSFSPVPRLRPRGKRKSGSPKLSCDQCWQRVTEVDAALPNYLFARFDLAACLRQVCHSRGVRGVVHFGDRWPIVPESVIEELRVTLGGEPVHVIREALQPGETVQIAGGVFHGLRAVITRVMPSRERVAVLLEFLGQQTSVELAGEALIREGDERTRVL